MSTIRELLRWGAERLVGTEVARPAHEAAILLGEATGLSKERLYARLTEEVEPAGAIHYEELVSRRSAGLPVAYLLGEKEFYGRSFRSDPRALIPRPETEILVDRALEIARRLLKDEGRRERVSIHDCCTGSGCIAITIAAELAEDGYDAFEVTASDISPEAVDLARENGERLAPGLVSFRQADLLEGVAPGSQAIITANPPYLSSRESSEALGRGWGEPRLALDGGAEGFDLLPRIVREALASLRQNGYILVEAAASQAAGIRSLMREAGFVEIETAEDLAGRERVTIGKYDRDHR